MLKMIEDFIREHTHINYCEAIINKEGLIEYAVPSHVEHLIRITGEDREEIYKKMPLWDAPILWLIEYTGCIAVYTNGYIKPQVCTTEQQDTLKKLIDSGLIKNAELTIGW